MDGSDQRKMLVAHDYRLGYFGDACLEAVAGQSGYTLTHWGGVDLAVYFSHSRIGALA